MKLKFKQGSEVQKVVQQLFETKENAKKQAVKIIEEVTGCKVLETSQLGYSWCFDWSYMWSFKNVYFDRGVIDVPGYIHEINSEGIDHHRINKRKKTIYNTILERFQKEVKTISIKPLYAFGIRNEAEHVSYGWVLEEDANNEVVMHINSKIFDLLDLTKSIENGEQTITVEQ